MSIARLFLDKMLLVAHGSHHINVSMQLRLWYDFIDLVHLEKKWRQMQKRIIRDQQGTYSKHFGNVLS